MKKKQILIVEDERVVADDIKMSLMKLGYSVPGIVFSGEEAIKKAEETHPDLVLMDIVLKGEMDGIETAIIIRFRFNIPVVYLTAYADDKTLERAKKTEPYGYIVKPFEDRELNSVIEMALYKHKMEDMLRESEAFNFALFQYNPIATIVVDRKGRVLKTNQARRKAGDRCPNVGDVMYKDYAGKHEIDMHFELMECIRSSKKKEFPELKYGDKFLCITIAPFSKGAIITSLDITEHKRAEEENGKLQAQLTHSAKMAGIGTLASGIAHEFNNLLQIMGGYIEIAQKTKKAEDMEEAFNTVLSTSDKASKIIGDLLMFSRSEVSGNKFCDITEPIESVLILMKEQLIKHNIRVLRRYEKTPLIEVNKEEMHQVFLNMINNARDAMGPEGGKLEIDVKQVNEIVEVSFRDTGRGIKEENLSKVFEPFYTTKGTVGGTAIAGTGLGLSISYGIVKRHGGTIEVESEVNKGTIFTIRLPVKKARAKRRVVKYKKRKKVKKRWPLKILVVDDEEEICKLFTKFLSAKGYSVKAVATGRKAINQVMKNYFDVVFLDIVMPGIPPIDVLEKIKKISSKTRVVMITGKLLSDELLKKLRQKGASGFLQKPFKIEDIIESIIYER